MERAVAIKKLIKLLGKQYGYRLDPRAPTHDEREEAKRELQHRNAAVREAREMVERRKRDILEADQTLKVFQKEYEEAKKWRDHWWKKAESYRFTVGTTDSLFFYIRAQGDSWEDVIAKLEGKRK